MKKVFRTLRNRVGRDERGIERNIDLMPEDHQELARNLLYRVNRIRTQKPKDKNKLYADHAPEVESISKVKAHKTYEFGVKAGVVSILKKGFLIPSVRIHDQTRGA